MRYSFRVARLFTAGLLLLADVSGGRLHAAAPREINYQGKLANTAGVPLTGSHSIKFEIFDDPAAGASLWPGGETHVLSVDKGVFSARIGSVGGGIPASVFQGSGDRWLQISVDGSALSPRQKMVSAPFALSLAAGSIGTDEIADGSVSLSDLNLADIDSRYATLATAQTFSALKTFGAGLNVTAGSVGIGTSSPASLLDVNGAAQFGSAAKSTFTASGALNMAAGQNITLSGGGKLKGLSGSPTDADEAASKQYVDALVGGSAGGWTDAGSVVHLSNAGDTLGAPAGAAGVTFSTHVFIGGSAALAVGTSSPDPAARLHVAGQMKITGGSPGLGKVLTSDAGGLASWEAAPSGEQTTASNGLNLLSPPQVRLGGPLTQNTDIALSGRDFTFSGAGNVGIGTTAPAAKLHVAGQMKITGGSPAAGRVLTSDATGLASWAVAPSGEQTTASNGLNLTAAPEVRLGGALSQNTDIALAGRNMTFSGAGNMGIGTTTPDAKLHVAGQVKITGGSPLAGRVLTTDANGLATWEPIPSGEQTTAANGLTEVANDEVRLGGTLDGPTEINQAGFDLFYTGLGNVGIGTTAPGAKLHVAGQMKITGGGPAAGRVLTSDATGLATWEPVPSTELTTAGNGLTEVGNEIRLGGTLSGPTDINMAGSNLSLSGVGFLGVGTTVPDAKLHVAGQVKITGGAPGAGKILISDADGLASWSALPGDQTVAGNGLELSGVQVRLGGVLDAATDINMGANNLTFTGTGLMGIGTTAPDAKLHVAGQVKITGGAPGLGKVLTSDASGLASWGNLPEDATTASNGLTEVGNDVRLGGALSVPTSIDMGGHNLTFTGTGNVGIGSATPSARLDVVGDIAVSGTVDGVDIGASYSNWDTAFSERRQWDGGSANLNGATGRLSLGLGALSTLSSVSGGPAGNILDNSITNDDLLAGNFGKITGVGALSSLTVTGDSFLATTSGNVGIGTSSPSFKLHVNGDVGLTKGGNTGEVKVGYVPAAPAGFYGIYAP
jgi:ribosomal protein S6E (S10)